MKGKTRRSVVVLAVVTMIAALLALPVAGVSAATPAAATYPATYSACPSGSIPASSFTDSSASFAKADIDCIAYYGISLGTSATTFDPSSVVTREQMALFLIRAAGPAGVTLGAGVDQGFTDIAGLSAESQKAINQLAELGITKGTSATTYGPAGTVTREQMALFLDRFLGKVTEGPGSGMTAAFDAGTGFGVDFTDIGAVAFEAHNAITELFELGVTTGTTATTFSPSMSVTREQMASFIGRALAHTNARPAGVSMQIDPTSVFDGDTVDVAISVRDSSFMPIENALVDVFEATSANKAKALKTDGTCDAAYVTATFGGTACSIDLADPDTGTSGNIEVGVIPAASTIWWAWSGATDDTFDADTTQVASAEATVSAAATDWEISDNVAKYAAFGDANSDGNLGWEDGGLVKFGTTVTLTAQLVDATGDPVALAGEDIWFGSSLSIDDVWQGDTIYKLVTDATGKATLSFTHTDPSSTGDNAAIEEWWVENNFGYGEINSTNGAFGDDYVWEDDAAAAETTVAGTTGPDYGTGNSLVAKATVYDQYGAAKSGVTVTFTDTGADFTTVDRVTNSSGVATQTITDTTDEIDTVTADAGLGTLTDTVELYFGINATSGPIVGPMSILSVDDSASKIVANDLGVPTIYTYDSGDNFYVSGSAMSFADFVEDLDTYANLDGANYDTAGISTFRVS